MKAKLLHLLLGGMCTILLSGCGNEVEVLGSDDIVTGIQESHVGGSATVRSTENPVAESTMEPATESTAEPAASVTPEEVAETRAVYKQALLTVLNELKLPDGTELYFDGIGELSQNKFAIHDVDGDGREELILSYVTGPMAVQGKYVFGYDPETDTVYQQAVGFSMVFYDNGIIKADASHNHGRGDKLWPYTVYYYSPITDDYRYGVHLDSWEKAYYGETAQGTTFPTEADADGDGIVYYMMPYDDYSYSTPIDGAEYQEWYERQFGSAEIIKPTYYELTKENIEKVGAKEP